MRRLRQPNRTANSLLRLAIRQASAAPVLTCSMLLGLAPAGQALTLGDISVRSTLGQRLDATIPVRLGAGETLASTCVVPGQQGSDLRRVPGAEVIAPQVAREGVYELRVTSGAPLYEPMYELELKVQCPGAPILVRQYVLMLDLPGAVAASVPNAAGSGTAPVPVAPGTVTVPVAAQAPLAQPRVAINSPTGKIAAGSRYRVAEGDTLSGLALRVQGRDVSLQDMADAIQAANPDAFIRNDANLIKLGSEITIPVTAVAPLSADVPSPALPQALDPVLRTPTPAAAPVAETAVAKRIETAPPVESTPVSSKTPTVATAPVRPAPRRTVAPAVASTTAATDEPNAFVAAAAGIAFGLLVSALLWLRGRLPTRKRPAPAVAPQADESSSAEPPAFATMPLVMRAAEPGFSVSFTPANEDALAAAFADEPEPTYAVPSEKAPRSVVTAAPAPSEDITSELEGMFDGTDTTIQKRLNAEETLATRDFQSDEDGYNTDAPDSDVDFLVGEPTGEEATLRAATVDQPRPNLTTAQSPTVDLRTLARSATKDQQQAQTLLEALTLLERDYEEELTASQVLDISAVRDALGSEMDEPTQISGTCIREASARKRSR